MALALARPAMELIGISTPRIAPPEPIHHLGAEYAAAASCMGITLMPWQTISSHYMMADGPDGWLFREFADVVARRNGKTELLLPRLHYDLDHGRRAIHTAQNRTLPRQVFLRLAHHYEAKHAKELDGKIRYANGQEEMVMRNGGGYLIVAPQRGARGLGADTFIFDELREFEDDDILAAATPTLASSKDPQRIYLSNAGTSTSVVLNDLKRRSDDGATGEFGLLAYLEWSASPERTIDDRAGWAEANPALGRPEHPAGLRMMANLEDAYRTLPAATFETEYLCRWVASMQPKLVSEASWQMCHGEVSTPERPALAFNMAADGSRASAAMAWQMADGRVALVEVKEAFARDGTTLEVDALGPDLQSLAVQHRARKIGFASWTDSGLARHLPRAKPIDGKDYANASGLFAQLVSSGRLVWSGAEHITDDLAWTSRKPHESGAWTAVPATPERSVTAALAAIRAVWLASAPKPPAPRIG